MAGSDTLLALKARKESLETELASGRVRPADRPTVEGQIFNLRKAIASIEEGPTSLDAGASPPNPLPGVTAGPIMPPKVAASPTSPLDAGVDPRKPLPMGTPMSSLSAPTMQPPKPKAPDTYDPNDPVKKSGVRLSPSTGEFSMKPVTLGSGSTRRMLYGDRHLPKKLLSDLKKREDVLKKAYGDDAESYTDKYIKAKTQLGVSDLVNKFGMSEDEAQKVIASGKLPKEIKDDSLVGQKKALFDEISEVHRDYSERLGAVLGEYEEVAPGLKAKIAKVEADLEFARNMIKNSKVDPMKGVPAWGIALMALGAGLQEAGGRMSGGRAGGGNVTVNLFNGFLNAKKAEQQAELDKWMDLYKLDRQQRDYLHKRLDENLDKQAALSKALSISDLAEIGVRENKINYIMKSMDAISGLADSIRATEYKARTLAADKIASGKEFTISKKMQAAPVKTSAWRQAMPKGADVGKPADPTTKRKFIDGVGALQRIYKARDMYDKYTPIRGTKWLGGKTAKYESVLTDALVRHLKSMSGVAARPEEYKRIREMYGEGLGPREWSKSQGLWKYDQLIDSQIQELGNMVRMNPDLLRAVPKKWKRQVFQAASGQKVTLPSNIEGKGRVGD